MSNSRLTILETDLAALITLVRVDGVNSKRTKRFIAERKGDKDFQKLAKILLFLYED